MVNSGSNTGGEMRCGRITMTWDLNKDYQRTIEPENGHFLSLPVVIRPVKCIGHNPLIVIDNDELRGVYVITPGKENITAWDSLTSRLFDCKFSPNCNKPYCAFVGCKKRRTPANIIGELNKINQDGYPRDLEIRIFSDNEVQYHDEAMVSRDHDVEMLTRMVKQHPSENKLRVMQVAVHRQTMRFTPKPAPPPPKQKNVAPKQQTFKVDETGAYRRNIREALSKLNRLVDELDDEEFAGEDDKDNGNEESFSLVKELREVISILSGEKFRDEEIEKIRKQYEAFLDNQNRLFQEKVNSIMKRNQELAKNIVPNAETTESQPNEQSSGTNTNELPLPPPPPTSTKKWSEIVDGEDD
jgi:hypothetical protein